MRPKTKGVRDVVLAVLADPTVHAGPIAGVVLTQGVRGAGVTKEDATVIMIVLAGLNANAAPSLCHMVYADAIMGAGVGLIATVKKNVHAAPKTKQKCVQNNTTKLKQP